MILRHSELTPAPMGSESVKLPCPGRRTRKATRILKGIIFVLLSLSTFLAGIPLNLAEAATSGDNSSSLPTTVGSQLPRRVGANPVPDLSLPQTVLSSVDSLIGAGGVVQASPGNITLYNPSVTMRLLGGPLPHDELLSSDRRILSSWSFWSAEAQIAGTWVPLPSTSSNFTVLGTNITGTFLVRTMQVSSGTHSGVLKIAYKATAAGPLKWDLEFAPHSSGHYRIVYLWRDLTTDVEISETSKRFRVLYGGSNYTFSWHDIPDSFQVSTDTSPIEFSLQVDLGVRSAGSIVVLDPTLVRENIPNNPPTSHSFQRKIFYEPTGGNYWIFYYDGTQIRYSYSSTGTIWSSPQYMPPDWPAWSNPEASFPAVFNIGQRVYVAAGETLTGTYRSTWRGDVSVYLANGTITQNYGVWRIDWQFPLTPWVTLGNNCNDGTYECTMTMGMRYVNIAAGETLAVSFNWYVSRDNIGTCGSGSGYSSSQLYVAISIPRTVEGVSSTCSSFHDTRHYRSVIVPADQGSMRLVYQSCVMTGSNCPGIVGLSSALFSSGGVGVSEPIQEGVDGDGGFSAVYDDQYNAYAIYRGTDLKVSAAFRSVSGSTWTVSPDIFEGYAQYPSLTVDLATNDVYAVAVQSSSIVMRSKLYGRSWGDTSLTFLARGRDNPSHLGTNLESVSTSSSNKISIIWSEGSRPYSVWFASVPIQRVWSPFASPTSPWDGYGLAPSGQYFRNLGEYVSTSTGMLTVRQTDLVLPGRGLDVAITRIYTEPYSFMNGEPYNYESYPWAPMGKGWQLNFPWLSKSGRPVYLHLWEGQGYRIPYDFWTGTNGTYENHQGEHLRLVRYENGTIVLFSKSGVYYRFVGLTYQLDAIVDTTGRNVIRFSYSAGRIASITDSIGRTLLFCYNLGILDQIIQATGSCSSPTNLVRSIDLEYNAGGGLSWVADPAGRRTLYAYGSGITDYGVGPWILSQITYPTGGYTSYAYRKGLLGTEASTYRVEFQTVTAPGFTPGQYEYWYDEGPGDQITSSRVFARSGNTLASITVYEFSFAGMNRTVRDPSYRLVSSVQHTFGPNGDIVEEILLVTDGTSNVRSYSNSYRYDSWGNMIYSRKEIIPDANWPHETFYAYYSNGLSLGFYNIDIQPVQGVFTNNFYPNSLNPDIHDRIAGRAELQNGTQTTPIEAYYKYTPWGGLSETRQRYDFVPNGYYWIRANATYDLFGNLKTRTDPMGNTVYNEYNSTYNSSYLTNQTQVVTGQPSIQITWRFDYDPNMGYLLSTRDPRGNITAYQNDILGRVTRTNYPPTGQDYVQYDYSGQSDYVNITNQAGWKTRQVYDGLGRLIRQERFLGPGVYSTEEYSYNGQNLLTSRKDPSNRVYSYQYDSLGRTTQVTKPDGGTIRISYNDIESWVRTTYEDNVYRCQVYDRLGQLVSVVEQALEDCSSGASSITTNYYYDEVGNLVRVVDANQRTTSHYYDNLGRLTRTVGPDSVSEQYEYDDNGSLVQKIDRKGVKTLYGYDSLNSLKTITYCGNPVTSDNYDYDTNGNLVRLQNLNTTLTYRYDARNRLLSEAYKINYGSTAVDLGCSGGGGGSVAYGTLITMVDGSKRPVQQLRPGSDILVYDVHTGRTAVATLRDIQIHVVDSLLTIHTETGAPFRTDVNPQKRLYVLVDGVPVLKPVTEITTGDRVFHYDTGRWVRVTDVTRTFGGDHVMFDLFPEPAFDYIANGYSDCPCKEGPVGDSGPTSATSTTIPGAGVPQTYVVNYTYIGDTLDTIRYPGNLLIRYQYDPLGRIANVSKVDNTPYYYARFTYFQDDQAETVTLGNEVTTAYAYDSLGRPSTLTVTKSGGTELMSLTYGYNRTGTIASITGRVNNVQVNEQYRYDTIGRLVNSDVTSSNTNSRVSYVHDSLGNWLSRTLDAVSTTYTYDELNRLENSTSNDAINTRISYAYDRNGYLTGRNVTTSATDRWSYTWDSAGRLVKVTKNGFHQGTYAYDAMGRRVESKEGSATTPTFFAFQDTETLQERTGSSYASYVYAGGLRIARVSGNAIRYYHTDHLGSTRLVTNTANNPRNVDVVFYNNYQPFGTDNGAAGGSESSSHKHKFTGKPYSSTTGLYYSFQRWYDPEIGRFISEDPVLGRLSNPQTLNRYTYVGNSPTNYGDPTGLFWDYVVDPFFIAWDIWDLVQNPTWVNAGLLAADVVLAIVPFVPAVGGAAARAARVVSKIDDVLDAGRTLSNTGDAARLVTHLDDITKITGRIDDAIDTSRFWRTLERGGVWTGKYESHHLFPKQFASFFNRALHGTGQTIGDFTIMLERNVHKVLHGKGVGYSGSWNDLWEGFYQRFRNVEDPTIVRKAMLEFLDDLRVKFYLP